MNKTELVAAVAAKTTLTKKDTETTINALLDVIETELKNGGNVQLVGFGNFEVKARKARMGRNPQKPTDLVEIPESKAPVFKAGKALKDAVNK